MGGFTLNATEQAALDRLVPRERQTGDVIADLIAGAREAWRRRQQNTDDGGAVLAALYRDARSWRTVSYLTKIPTSTAHRWAIPPSEADADRPPPPERPAGVPPYEPLRREPPDDDDDPWAEVPPTE